MADELGAPLRRRKDRLNSSLGGALRLMTRLPLTRIVLALVLLVICGLALAIVLIRDPHGGRPVAEAAINSSVNSVASQLATAPAEHATITAGPETPVGPDATSTGTGAGPAITTVGDATPDAPLVIDAGTQVDPDLVEQTKDGPIPRMGPTGKTPFATYASPVPATAAGKPRIAIVVTGLGLSQAGTLDAIRVLPSDVALAFAPYGKTLDKTVSAARSAGHELLLEAPLEPFDYPDNDPGPQTLLTGQPPRSNLDKLFWLMTRFGGYIGLTNYMGARFTASAADFAPIMEELGARGLGYLDDGSSNRSVAPQLAAKDKVPFARADINLDVNPDHDAILDALAVLEQKARTEGRAIGIISALPVSVQTVSEWARTLEGKDLALVPVSALMN